MAHAPCKIAVFGAGAVGSYFGGMLARAGLPVVLIGRDPHVRTIRGKGLEIESVHFHELVRVEAATEPEAVRGAEFVLVCVKTYDTESAARALAPHLDSGAICMSLQNGVGNAETVEQITGRTCVPSVVYVAAALEAPGKVVHRARGDLILGHRDAAVRAKLQEIAELFARAGVPCRVSETIDGELWMKLILNVAGNAVTALSRASFRQVAEHPLTREIVAEAARETMRVAEAAGVRLPVADPIAMGLELARTLGDATSSMAQDIAQGKRTEVDAFNGYGVRRGRELGVPTPVNATLYALVKLLEESAAKTPQPGGRG